MPRNVIKENSLVLKGNLSRGYFGHVKKATWTSGTTKTKKTVDVALKFFFKDGFKEELVVMSELKNKNIVKLYGTSKVNGEPCLVMNQGCLSNFVRKNEKKLMSERSVIKNILKDVASGMKCLARKGFVHRDLAARNVLVHLDTNLDTNLDTKNVLTGKIADFGLARDDTYYQSRYGVAAFYWMPPEVHDGHGHTPASDVWSFGILCWEPYTFGREPFSGLRTPQVKAIVKTKKVPLKCPKYCPPTMFETIKKCWTSDPRQRITFTKLVRELENTDRG